MKKKMRSNVLYIYLLTFDSLFFEFMYMLISRHICVINKIAKLTCKSVNYFKNKK